jgi:urease accessory protein
MHRSVRSAAAFAASIGLYIAACPAHVEAHLNSTGLGPIYDGALHLLSSPEDLVPALALALLAGLRGAGHGRIALFALPAAWLLGGLAGIAVGHGGGAAVAIASFLLLGALVAADARLSLTLLTALTVSLGLIHGYVNGTDMRPLDVGCQALIGLAAALFVLIALVVALVLQLHRSWSRIAVRVLGSWIVASGLLMLGWAMHPAPR